jgi:hypothetical protein
LRPKCRRPGFRIFLEIRHDRVYEPYAFAYTIAAVVEATDQPDDLSGYHETPTHRVLLIEGRQACYGDKRAFESAGGEW